MRLIDADTIFPNGCVTVWEWDGEMTADGILKAIKDVPTVDAVSIGVYEQVCWERDVAMQQLKDNGIRFGSTDKVEPVRHGEWIVQKVDANQTKFYCSECERTVFCGNDYFMKPSEYVAKIYPYCHCGAKMDLKEHNLKRIPHVIIHRDFEDYWEECSICGYRDISINDSLCPNCGAKMDKGVKT